MDFSFYTMQGNGSLLWHNIYECSETDIERYYSYNQSSSSGFEDLQQSIRANNDLSSKRPTIFCLENPDKIVS